MRNKKLAVLFIVLSSLAVLILLSSVVFSVQHINASCFNDDDTTNYEQIVNSSQIKKGSSIFTLNEKKIINNIHSKVFDIKILNIERKFPNIVYINYVKVHKYLSVAFEGKHYIASNEGKIIDIIDIPLDKTEIIELKMNGGLKNTEKGQLFSSSDSYEIEVITELFSALERLGFKNEIVEMFDFIDITRREKVILKTSSGVFFELFQSTNLLQKLQTAISLYSVDKYKNSGTIVVNNSTPNIATYKTSSPIGY